MTRGLKTYGRPVRCTYGTEIVVRQSSAAGAPRLWLFVKESGNLLEGSIRDRAYGKAAVHLSRAQAQGLVARLTAWLKDLK